MNHKILAEMELLDLKPWLDEWVTKIERPSYIEDDPVLFLHAYEDKSDQELAGFFAAIMAWGRRDIVISKVGGLLDRMQNQPSVFIRHFSESDFDRLEGFKHRTFKPIDIYWLIRILQAILRKYDTFEAFWSECYREAIEADRELLAVFHDNFFSFFPEMPQRTRKHVSNPEKNSSCKRLYLFLRWVIRNDSPVDTGIMNFMDPSELKIPLDVHVARQARKLGILKRSYNDWKATCELTEKMRILDPDDPAKYDYALFGLGVSDATIPENYLVNPRIST